MTNHKTEKKKDEACLYLIATKYLRGLNDILKQLDAVFNGAGWFIEEKHRARVEEIKLNTGLPYYEHPLNGETFPELRRRHKRGFYEDNMMKTRSEIDRLKLTMGKHEDLDDLMQDEHRTVLEKSSDGKKLLELLEKHEHLTEQIKRAEAEERIANMSGESSFKYLLENNSEQKLIEELKNVSPGISTGFTIGEVDLIIPGGAITITAAPTSHGKTSTLINFVLGALNHHHDKSVYFFTYEESGASIISKFLNTYIDKELSKNNRESIKSHFINGNVEHIKIDMRDDFLRNKKPFFENLIDKGRLKVFYSDMPVEELIAAIHFIKKNDPHIGMICIDYMQFLKLVQRTQGSRQEELKEICLRLKDCAIATGLPILLAAQFNRTVVAEADLSPTAIGEAGDIERAASMVIGMWNRNFVGLSRDGNIDKAKNKIPKESTIYFEIMKGREIGNGHNCVMDFNGNTGKIKNRINQSVDNYKAASIKEPTGHNY